MPRKGAQKNRGIAQVCVEAFAAAIMGKTFSKVVEINGRLLTVQTLRTGEVRLRVGDTIADVLQILQNACEKANVKLLLNRRNEV